MYFNGKITVLVKEYTHKVYKPTVLSDMYKYFIMMKQYDSHVKDVK